MRAQNLFGSASAVAFLVAALSAIAAARPARADANQALLTGAVASAQGGDLNGVTVSAKEEGTPITTSVYTDETGHYYFPPMPAGHYRVWAQALTFETAKKDVDLTKVTRQDFALQPMEDFIRQLPGDEILAALPDGAPEQARMKTLISKTCTSCHSASYPLQHKFDEKGWTAVLDLMKSIDVYGDHLAKRPPDGSIQAHEKELAAYLAQARGPGPTSMVFHLRPRPSGEAARVVFREYDVPIDPDLNPPTKYLANNGSDWSLGTPSGLAGGFSVHDAWADLDGNLWFTHDRPSKTMTIGLIDAKTGAFKAFPVIERNGYAAEAHGLTRDEHGNLWFNTRPAAPGGDPTGLAKVDPKTHKIIVYAAPKGTETEGTLDVDGKGMVWVTTPDGALRFDPKQEEFVNQFHSLTYKTKNGVGVVYGLAGDADGNGWWLDMKFDHVEKGDVATGKTAEVKLQPDEAPLDQLTQADKVMYATYVVPDFNTPFPWSQGPRRMGADKNGDTVWVGDSFGGNLARFNIHTLKHQYIDLPNPVTMQPYEVYVDQDHNVWTNLWSTDAVAKYDPNTSKWTLFDLPTRGTESRYISMLEKPNGKSEVVIPYYRTSKIAVMTFRSPQDMQNAKKAVGQP
jgi:streptogramin lyase